MARLARTPRKWWPIGGGGGGGGDRPSWLTSWVTAALLGSLLVDLAHRQGMMPALQPGAAATAACHTQPAQPAVAAATAATGSSSAGPGGLPSAVPSYNFTLEARTLDRGVVMQGDSARTRRALVKLLNGQRTTVVFVGGSASWCAGRVGGGWGARSTRWPPAWLPGQPSATRHPVPLHARRGTGVKDRSLSFASRTLAWVNASFPARPPGGGHAVLNGARYAATSTYVRAKRALLGAAYRPGGCRAPSKACRPAADLPHRRALRPPSSLRPRHASSSLRRARSGMCRQMQTSCS